MRNLPASLLTVVFAVTLPASGTAAPASPTSAFPTGSQNWPQTYFNPGLTQYNPNETTLSPSNVSQLQLLWAGGINGGVTQFAVDNGAIFVESQNSDPANLAAFNARTGAQLWSTTAGNGGYNSGTLATAQGLIFSYCSLPDSGGTSYGAICAFQQSTGTMVWEYGNPCNCLPESGVETPLTYADGVVIFGYAVGGVSGTEYLAAVNAANGKLIGTYNTGGYNSIGGTAPAAGGGDIYFWCEETGNTLCALSASTRSLAWSTSLGGSGLAVSVANGVVYASTGYNSSTNGNALYALNARTGATLWTYSYPAMGCGSQVTPQPPAVAWGGVFFLGADKNLYALNAKTGALVWDNLSSDSCGGFTTSPALANGVLYIMGGSVGTLAAYSARTGALLWSSPAGLSTLNAEPEVANGVLYGGNMSGPCGLCAFALPSTRAHSHSTHIVH